MSMKIRLARGGSKKRPFYRIVAADSRMPRDGRYIEKLGTYNPLLSKDSEDRVKMNLERIKYWLGQGAQATDRVSRMLEAAGHLEKKDRNNPIKAQPGQKAKDRQEEKEKKSSSNPVANQKTDLNADTESKPSDDIAIEESQENELAKSETNDEENGLSASSEVQAESEKTLKGEIKSNDADQEGENLAQSLSNEKNSEVKNDK